MIAETELRIAPEFASLIPPMTPEELAQLNANLIADGCREPLVVWAEEDALLDGHNRYRVCKEHDITFDVTPLNGLAKGWVSEQTSMTEQQWITLLYRIRGTDVPDDLFEDKEVEI